MEIETGLKEVCFNKHFSIFSWNPDLSTWPPFLSVWLMDLVNEQKALLTALLIKWPPPSSCDRNRALQLQNGCMHLCKCKLPQVTWRTRLFMMENTLGRVTPPPLDRRPRQKRGRWALIWNGGRKFWLVAMLRRSVRAADPISLPFPPLLSANFSFYWSCSLWAEKLEEKRESQRNGPAAQKLHKWLITKSSKKESSKIRQAAHQEKEATDKLMAELDFAWSYPSYAHPQFICLFCTGRSCIGLSHR